MLGESSNGLVRNAISTHESTCTIEEPMVHMLHSFFANCSAMNNTSVDVTTMQGREQQPLVIEERSKNV